MQGNCHPYVNDVNKVGSVYLLNLSSKMVQLIVQSLGTGVSVYAESEHLNNGMVSSSAVTCLIGYHDHELLISSND